MAVAISMTNVSDEPGRVTSGLVRNVMISGVVVTTLTDITSSRARSVAFMDQTNPPIKRPVYPVTTLCIVGYYMPQCGTMDI